MACKVINNIINNYNTVNGIWNKCSEMIRANMNYCVNIEIIAGPVLKSDMDIAISYVILIILFILFFNLL